MHQIIIYQNASSRNQNHLKNNNSTKIHEAGCVGLQEETDKSKIIIVDFKIPLSIIDWTSIEKICIVISDLNNTIK